MSTARKRWQRPLVAALVLLALAAVVSRLDLSRLAALWHQADALLMLLALPIGLLVVLAAGVRYRVLMLASGAQHPVPRVDVLEYWRSLGIGLLGPGTLGSDVYRVVVAGRRSRRYGAVALVVVIEKFGALAACALLAAAALPFAAPRGLQVGGWSVQALLAWLIAASVLALLLLPAAARHPRARRWIDRLRQRFGAWTQNLARRGEDEARQTMPAGLDGAPPPPPSPVPTGSATRMFGARTLLLMLLWSLVAMGLSALQAQLFFDALGVSVPLLVNLFVTPLLFIVLSLPLTPGGVGVRELSFIAFYGALGVPAEAALMVSFCFLASVLLSQGIGALLFLRSDGREAVPEPR